MTLVVGDGRSTRSATCCGPTFWERFPTLKFSLTEGDIGWIPYFLCAGRARAASATRAGRSTTFPDGGGPTEHLPRPHPRAASSTTTSASSCSTEFNIDNVCWESDYPHSDSDWPNAPEESLEVLGAARPTSRSTKITHENAMRHYQFDPFAIRPQEQCTAAALRAESPDVDTVTRVGRPATERDAEIFKYALRGIKVPAGRSASDRGR